MSNLILTRYIKKKIISLSVSFSKQVGLETSG